MRTPEGETIEEKLEKKLEVSNIKAGTDISLSVDGNNITINNASKGVLIDNLDTETSGLGSLDAHQGKVLKDMIPDVVNNLTTVSTDKALSAYQGYLLNHKVVPTGGTTGQVLKKSSNDDHALEWGDAADPNAIVGDGSIKKIVELTYEEYQALEAIDPDTEYHILDVQSSIDNLEKFVTDLILEADKRKHPIGSLEFNVSGTNPSVYLGFGTWELWGAGRVPVGVDVTQDEFNTVEKTGGDKTVSLTKANLPNYDLTSLKWSNNWALTLDGGTSGNGYKLAYEYQNYSPGQVDGFRMNSGGENQPHNNLQPYITCYMWKRTA